LLLGEASDGYEYDGQTGTFCVEPFQAGEAVTLDVSYVVSKANQNFPPDDIYGIGTWGDPEASYVIGAYSAPFFPATWMLAPNTMPWIDAAHNRRCRSGCAERGHRRRWGAAEKNQRRATQRGECGERRTDDDERTDFAGWVGPAVGNTLP
jgi:hypothetical protein